MLYWWELVKDLPVPKPKTVIVKLRDEDVAMFFDCFFALEEGRRSEECVEFRSRVREILEELKRAAEQVRGYPVFLRSDYTSGKHYSYRNPLYRIESPKDFAKIWNLICECHEPMPYAFFMPPRPNALVV